MPAVVRFGPMHFDVAVVPGRVVTLRPAGGGAALPTYNSTGSATAPITVTSSGYVTLYAPAGTYQLHFAFPNGGATTRKIVVAAGTPIPVDISAEELVALATDAELAAGLASKQSAATAATDAELASETTARTSADAAEAVARAAADALKQDASTAATDAELAAGLASVGSVKVTKSAVALGTQAAAQSAFIYYEITNVCRRGLMSQFSVTNDGAGAYDIDLRSESGGGGIQLLAAVDANGTYEITVPVYLEGDEDSSLWLGIMNKGGASRTFTLAALRVEKFA